MTETGYESNPTQFTLVFAEDGHTEENSTEKLTATFAFVLNDSGEVLTLQNERGWDIPGGHIDGEETVLEATHREVLEEACVTINDPRLFAVIKNGKTAMAVFLARPKNILEFEQNDEDPTSNRTFMNIDVFKSCYSGGDKTMMFNLLDRLPKSKIEAYRHLNRIQVFPYS